MANYVISNTGGNWNNPATWVPASPVGGPTSADTVTATATSGNLTVTANASITSIDFTNYVGTFSVNAGVTLSFAASLNNYIRMVAGMTVAPTSTGTLRVVTSNNTTSYFSGGNAWPGTFLFEAGGGRTWTFGDAWTIKDVVLRANVASTSITLNGFSITVLGNLTVGDVVAAGAIPLVIGTTNIIMGTSGTSTITSANPSAAAIVGLRCPLTFNAPGGTIVFSTPTAKIALQNVTWTAGTVTTAGATLYWTTSSTLTTSGMTWDATIIFAGATITIAGTAVNVSSTGSVQVNTSTQLNWNTTMNLSGNLTMLNGILNGGVWNLLGSAMSVSQGAAGSMRCQLTINSPGTVTFTTDFRWGGGSFTFTHTAGTFSMSNSLTWTNIFASGGVQNTYNLTTASGISFPNFVNEYVVDFQNVNGVVNFYSYTCITAGRTQRFWLSATFNVTNALTLVGSSASPITFTAFNGVGTRAIFTVNGAASQDVAYVNATNIDSSLGQTVWNFGGTLSNTLNWNPISAQPANLGAPFA
jgi:hypothetical protein